MFLSNIFGHLPMEILIEVQVQIVLYKQVYFYFSLVEAQ